MPTRSGTGEGPALPFKVRFPPTKPFDMTETAGRLRQAEKAVENLILGRRNLSQADRARLRTEFQKAFHAARAACDIEFFDDYDARNIVMGVSYEAAGIFVKAKKDIDLDAMLEDLRFVPTAIAMHLSLERGDEFPRVLRAVRLYWEANGRPNKIPRGQVEAYVDVAQVGVKRKAPWT